MNVNKLLLKPTTNPHQRQTRSLEASSPPVWPFRSRSSLPAPPQRAEDRERTALKLNHCQSPLTYFPALFLACATWPPAAHHHLPTFLCIYPSLCNLASHCPPPLTYLSLHLSLPVQLGLPLPTATYLPFPAPFLVCATGPVTNRASRLP